MGYFRHDQRKKRGFGYLLPWMIAMLVIILIIWFWLDMASRQVDVPERDELHDTTQIQLK
jgi:hypothetical protein